MAAILPSQAGREFDNRFRQMLEELEAKVGEREFHFVDLYNGKRRFRSLDISARFAYFEAFADLADALNVTFIVQSLGEAEAREWLEALEIDFPPLRKAFNLRKPGDLALFLLLLQINDYLGREMPTDSRAAVFIDEGWKRNRTGVWLGPLEKCFLHGLVLSARSSDVAGLQLADFGAFVLNRAHLVVGRNPLSRPDMWVIGIWRRLGLRFLNVAPRPFKVCSADGGGVHLVFTGETQSKSMRHNSYEATCQEPCPGSG